MKSLTVYQISYDYIEKILDYKTFFFCKVVISLPATNL